MANTGLNIIFLAKHLDQFCGILFKNSHGIQCCRADLQACFQRFRDCGSCTRFQQLVTVFPVTSAGVNGDVRVMLSQDTDQPHRRCHLVERAHQHVSLPGTRRFHYIQLAGIAVENREAVAPAFRYKVRVTVDGKVGHLCSL